MADFEKRKKETVINLPRLMNKRIRVKFNGGRECTGVLKGFDALLNLVMDDTTEFIRDPDDPQRLTDDTRYLGLVVCRGTSVVLLCPHEGTEEIPNPFVNEETV
ncbi:hypothetical protein GJ496_010888 [Pomphorhynchus laevis]|nr:hypothetical protein GJ496_010888 [Pomphorhynchus laevis]